MPLAEFQADMRNAIVDGRCEALAAVADRRHDPLKRFAIHRRHYEASLVRALSEKFPATVWLAGSAFVTAAAQDFIRQLPPSAPCIAEYGESFPDFLGEREGAERMAWLRWVGAPGMAARPGGAGGRRRRRCTIEQVAKIAPDELVERALTLQTGLYYLAAPWPVDELVNLFLSEAAPDRVTNCRKTMFSWKCAARAALFR